MNAKNKHNITLSFFVLLLLLVLILNAVPALALANGTESVDYEHRNVLDDLNGASINGSTFKLEDYKFDAAQDVQVLSFVEYCYSFSEEKQSDFGLYAYVYNPKGREFVLDSVLNKIQFATSDSATSHYRKYTLTYCNRSEKPNYEGMFYKFRINLTSEDKSAILQSVESTERVYRISGIELLTKGALNSTEYAVGDIYRYSGYAKGYASDSSSESTLRVNVEDSQVLTLDVRPTYYRPDGTNGKNEYTQDSLHSVYFAVPNEFIKRYGKMTAVHATWLNAVLKPMLVTGNKEAYDAINAVLGKTVTSDTLGYAYATNVKTTTGFGTMTDYDVGYNIPLGWVCRDIVDEDVFLQRLDSLYGLFYSGAVENSADGYTITSEEITEQLKVGVAFGGDLINGKYSKKMFNDVDTEFTEVNIEADEEYALTSEIIDKSWWDKCWGLKGDVITSDTFNGIKAIQEVNDVDVKGSVEDVCDRLYIAKRDYNDFKKYYDEKNSEYTVYLFRYQVSEYCAQEATLYKYRSVLPAKEIDTNAYFFQQTVNLDFDIIDVTFTGDMVHVIPVVASPQDIIHDGTPPVYTTSDGEFGWLLIAGIIVLVAFIELITFKIVEGD